MRRKHVQAASPYVIPSNHLAEVFLASCFQKPTP